MLNIIGYATIFLDIVIKIILLKNIENIKKFKGNKYASFKEYSKGIFIKSIADYLCLILILICSTNYYFPVILIMLFLMSLTISATYYISYITIKNHFSFLNNYKKKLQQKINNSLYEINRIDVENKFFEEFNYIVDYINVQFIYEYESIEDLNILKRNMDNIVNNYKNNVMNFYNKENDFKRNKNKFYSISNKDFNSYLKLLNLRKEDLNKENLKKAYKEICIKYHPDKNNGKDIYNFSQFNEAYSELQKYI